MQLGIFAKTFQRPTLAQTLDAVVEHGFDCIQFNFACVGLPSMPEQIAPEIAEHIAREMSLRGISLAAVSGTFNMIHPDPAKRQDGLRRLAAMAQVCRLLNTSTITLCTGSRDPENMWRSHPLNRSPEAWRDLIASLSTALEMTEATGVTFGIEPETANVIDSAANARKLLDEIKSPRLKIILDAANLFLPGDKHRMKSIIDEAVDLLADDIIAAHAKDFLDNGATVEHVAAGKGMLDYGYYVTKLRSAGFSGPLILHGLEENEISDSRRFVQAAVASSGREHVL
jgi:sugar phosphate isomerase/epimerase